MKNQLFEDAKLLKSIRFNWIDTLIIAITAGFLFLLREMFLPKLGDEFNTATRSFLTFPLLYLLIIYSKKVRPVLFSNERINKLLLLPKKVDNRSQFSIVGVLGLFPQWIGCMIILTSPISGPWNVEELSLSTDSAINQKAHEEAKRALMFENLNAIANAKTIDTAEMTPVEIHKLQEKMREQRENKEQNELEEEAYKKNFIEEKSKELFPKLKQQIHEEERSEHQELKKYATEQILRFLKFGFILLIIGGLIDKLNNIIQIHKQNKAK